MTTSTAAIGTDVVEQHVWHACADAYVDQLALRDRDSNDDGTLDERLYAMQDANFNVVGLTDSSQSVVERYAYDPYGDRTILDANYTTRTTSNYAWTFGHQGLHHDTPTGLIYNRARMLSPTLGRFMQRDPLGYVDGMSVYEYVRSNSQNTLDFSGLRGGGCCGGKKKRDTRFRWGSWRCCGNAEKGTWYKQYKGGSGRSQAQCCKSGRVYSPSLRRWQAESYVSLESCTADKSSISIAQGFVLAAGNQGVNQASRMLTKKASSFVKVLRTRLATGSNWVGWMIVGIAFADWQAAKQKCLHKVCS